jgi:hypothetical protein
VLSWAYATPWPSFSEVHSVPASENPSFSEVDDLQEDPVALIPGRIVPRPQHARKLYEGGEHTVASIASLLGVSRQTIYRA